MSRQRSNRLIGGVLRLLLCALAVALVMQLAYALGLDSVSYYYSSLPEALNAAADEGWPSSDARSGDAVAELRIYRGGRCREVMLLRDTELTESYTVENADFTLDLNGKSVRLDGATLSVTGGAFHICDGSIICESAGDFACAVKLSASERTELSLSELNIAASAGKTAMGITCLGTAEAVLTADNCKVSAVGTSNTGGRIISALITDVNTNASITLLGGEYTADERYKLINDSDGLSYATAIKAQQSLGELRLDGVRAIGVHSGITSFSNMSITRSYCASPTHGGMYNGGRLFADGTVFANIEYGGECTDAEEVARAKHLGAMYNGSSYKAAAAYLNACSFAAGKAPYSLVLSTNYGHISPSAYVSNCHIEALRVDGARESGGGVGALYIGKDVTYTLGLGGGVIDTERYAGEEFSETENKE